MKYRVDMYYDGEREEGAFCADQRTLARFTTALCAAAGQGCTA